jgi:hypothetical protein
MRRAHEKALDKAGVPVTIIQTAVRFAAIIQSVAVALDAGATSVQIAAARPPVGAVCPRFPLRRHRSRH